MRFKGPGLEAEFERAHPRVQAMALYLDAHVRRTLAHDVMVTSVERSQAEYDAIYLTAEAIANGEHYMGPKPHWADIERGIRSRAVDFRTIGELSDAEVESLVTHINQNWPRTDAKPSALFHNVGAGSHLHIQVEGV